MIQIALAAPQAAGVDGARWNSAIAVRKVDLSMDVLVVGAGVVGLAVARALAQRGHAVILVDAAGAIGTGTSSRNSEVIHAGMYYPAASLRARHCIAGRRMLYGYCESRGVPHRRCGKLIVATDVLEEEKIGGIYAQGIANGVEVFRS